MSDAIPASVRKAIDNADNAYEDLCLHGGSQTEADNADRLRDEAILAALTAAREAGRDEERARLLEVFNALAPAPFVWTPTHFDGSTTPPTPETK